MEKNIKRNKRTTVGYISKILIASVFLVLIALGGVAYYQYPDSDDEIKVCDSYTLNSEYKEMPKVCYDAGKFYEENKLEIKR